MTNTEIWTLIALVLNLITLVLVVRQTTLAKKSFQVAEAAFNNDIRLREADMLPKSSFIIFINMKLDEWLEIISSIEDELRIALNDENFEAIQGIADKYQIDTIRLVDKFYYEKSPEWLAEIFITSARHYCYVVSPMKPYANEKSESILKSFATDTIDRINESRDAIRELRSYIDKLVPKSYLKAPARYPDRDYLML